MSHKLKWQNIFFVSVITILALIGDAKAIIPSKPPVTSVSSLGNIDLCQKENGVLYIYGWSCIRGSSTSVATHLYANAPYGTGTLIAAGVANVSSEAAIDTLCATPAFLRHRFKLEIPSYHEAALCNNNIAYYGYNLGIPNNDGHWSNIFPVYRTCNCN